MWMVAFDGSELCDCAEVYYHDLLEDEESPAVPPEVVEHVRSCNRCRHRLECFRETLLEMEEEGEALHSREDRNLVGELEAQFAFLGEPLTCARAKRFLPKLLVPETPIRIPTPVTVHVDQCPECARDLESLRALNLSSAQLARLARLYAEGSGAGLGVCLRAQSSSRRGRRGSLEPAGARTADHLCVCPRCRNRFYQQRQRLLEREEFGSSKEGMLDCLGISDGDLFDFVVPYGNSAGSEDEDRLKRCGIHILSCPHCLAKAQQLHRMVYGVMERPDSGVVTVYRTRSSRAVSATQAESPYRDYPVDVQVIRRGVDEPVDRSARIRGFAKLKPVFRIALTAAAVIPVALVFIMSARSALGLTPRQLNETAVKCPYIHITAFGGDLQRPPKEEIWASRSLRLVVTESPLGRTVANVVHGRAEFTPAAGLTRDVLSGEEARLAAAKRTLDRVVGCALDEGRWNSELTRRDDAVENGVRLEVYELRFEVTLSAGTSTSSLAWMVYVDPATGRPVKSELRRWSRVEMAMVMEETRFFEYPTEGEFMQQLEELGVSRP